MLSNAQRVKIQLRILIHLFQVLLQKRQKISRNIHVSMFFFFFFYQFKLRILRGHSRKNKRLLHGVHISLEFSYLWFDFIFMEHIFAIYLKLTCWKIYLFNPYIFFVCLHRRIFLEIQYE